MVDDFAVLASVTASEIDLSDDFDFEITLVLNAVRCSEGSETFTPDANAMIVEADVYYLCLKVEGGSVSNINLIASYWEENDVYSQSLPLVEGSVVSNSIIGLTDVDLQNKSPFPL